MRRSRYACESIREIANFRSARGRTEIYHSIFTTAFINHGSVGDINRDGRRPAVAGTSRYRNTIDLTERETTAAGFFKENE